MLISFPWVLNNLFSILAIPIFFPELLCLEIFDFWSDYIFLIELLLDFKELSFLMLYFLLLLFFLLLLLVLLLLLLLLDLYWNWENIDLLFSIYCVFSNSSSEESSQVTYVYKLLLELEDWLKDLKLSIFNYCMSKSTSFEKSTLLLILLF